MNPFDDESGSFHVLVNCEGQYSLWPSFVAQPDGWELKMANESRDACIKFIEASWRDMRPTSLVEKMTEAEAEREPAAS